MISKINLVKMILSALLLSACNLSEDTEVIEKLKLTVGTTTVDCNATRQRSIVKISDARKAIGEVNINKNGIIRLEGTYAPLFQIVNHTLSFVSFEKLDSTLYDLDIKAFDTDGQVVVYKVAYDVDIVGLACPPSYTLQASEENINNHSDAFTPKIKSFSVTGNLPSQNNKVIISKSKHDAKFSYSMILEDYIYAQYIATQLKDGNKQFYKTFLFTNDEKYDFTCVFNDDKEGMNYTCNGVTIDNTLGTNDTELEIYVCNDKNITKLSTKCSSAKIPVLFID